MVLGVMGDEKKGTGIAKSWAVDGAIFES